MAGMETGTLICETRSMPPSVMGPAATDEGGAAAGDPAAAGPRRIELTGTVGSCGCEICNNSHNVLDVGLRPRSRTPTIEMIEVPSISYTLLVPT